MTDSRFKETIGSELKKWRLKRKLTLKDVSFLAGIDFSQVSRIEKGLVNITLETLEKLSNAYGAVPKVKLCKKTNRTTNKLK